MPTEAQSIYASFPFKFVIGGNPLYIHAALVSRNSKPLGVMINGHMAEAQKGFAVIDDVDEDTFLRFIQWAYNGFYDAAKYELDPELLESVGSEENGTNGIADKSAKNTFSWSFDPNLRPAAEPEAEVALAPPEAEAAPAPLEDDDRYWRNNFDKAKKSKKDKMGKWSSYESPVLFADPPTQSSKHDFKESFIKRKETLRKHSITRPQPRGNQAPNENYTKVFLSHAHLYVFADKYDIQPLKILALEELQAMLKIFDLHLNRTGDIIALLRYVYTNTSESNEGVEDMRTLLTHYVGFEMDTLMKDDDFRDLMIEDGGALLRDFMTVVVKRIC